ncbi:MAG: carbonic anhydrase [Bacteroidia bacterium]|nr:carbonic anhydrase [Bacteroidia bacterium]
MALSKEQQEQLTPSLALKELKEGHQRFVNGNTLTLSASSLINQTAKAQFPKAIVVSCIDSRVPVEQIFDQNIGDIFVARVAGNFINNDILASIEYACAVAQSPLVIVLGHEGCGAVSSACDGVKLGHITEMLQAITPAIENAQKTSTKPFNSSNASYVSSVTESNVLLNINKITQQSQLLKERIENGQLAICGGVYQIKNGTINWL